MIAKLKANQHDDYIKRYSAQSPYALYIHIPFCVQKCNYCDFASWSFDPKSDVRKRYVDALITYLDELRGLGFLDDLSTCYIGGGTPTVLEDELLRLVKSISKDSHFEEWTVEANPESLSEMLLDHLYTYGVNRLSIGTQSFVDDELKLLGRIHSANRAQEVISQALTRPYSVSLDLMCAFAQQTDDSWMQTLQAAISLNPHHISCYPLQIEDGTTFGRMLDKGEIEDVDDAVEATRMKLAAQYLEDAGYRRYEVASYAKESENSGSFASRHNRAYWTGQSYLGLGVSASSMLTRKQYQKFQTIVSKLPDLSENIERIRIKITSSITEFIQASTLADLSYELEFLTYSQALAEDMMLGCRMSSGVHPDLLEESKLHIGNDSINQALQQAVDEGLAIFDEHGFFKPTEAGWLMGNKLYGIFWEQVNQQTDWVSV